MALSYFAISRVGDIVAMQHVLRVELLGTTCLAQTYGMLREVQTFEAGRQTSARALAAAIARFEARGCAADAPAGVWPAIRAELRDAGNPQRRHSLVRALVGLSNSVGDATKLTYDSNPVVLDLADALAYALPEERTHLVDARSAPSRVAAAKLQATATEQSSTTEYDVRATFGLDRSLAASFAEPLATMRATQLRYGAHLDAWENGRSARQMQPQQLAAAMQAAVAAADRVYDVGSGALGRVLAGRLALLAGRLRVVWAEYLGLLAGSILVAWFIAGSSVRAQRRALSHVRLEASRLQAELARERAELELGIREAHFRSVFAGSPLAIAITDLYGAIVECNEAYIYFIGCTAADRKRAELLYPLSAEPPDVLAGIFAELRARPAGNHDVDILLTHRNERRVWCHAIVSVVPSASGPPAHCTVMLQDITDRKERERQLRYDATHDFLTGLPNRAFLIAALQEQLASAGDGFPRFALLFMDVDDFKSINDTLGHRAGDDCLKTVALRLTSLVREDDVVTRYGGDEFVILLKDPASVANAHEIAARISVAFKTPLGTGDATVTLSLSAGVTFDRPGLVSAEQIVREADGAMYREKRGSDKRLTTIRNLARAAGPA